MTDETFDVIATIFIFLIAFLLFPWLVKLVFNYFAWALGWL